MMKARRPILWWLVSSPVWLFSSVAAAWSFFSFGRSKNPTTIFHHHHRKGSRPSFLVTPSSPASRNALPHTAQNNILAYQVGDTYSEDQNWDENESNTYAENIEDHSLESHNDNLVSDYSGNTFGDVHNDAKDDLDDEHHDVFQLDGITPANYVECEEDSEDIEGTIDLEDEDLEYSLACDYVESYDHDAAETIFPCLDHWYVLPDDDNGCGVDDEDDEYEPKLSIAGIVSNHPRYPTGHAVITSHVELPLLDGLSPEAMVTTVTGSQYLLGHHRLELQLDDWFVNEDNDADELQITGTVSVGPPFVEEDPGSTQAAETAQVVERLGKLLAPIGQEITISVPPQQNSSEDEWHESMTISTALGQLYRLGSPGTTTEVDLSMAPLLHQWKRLEGGSIAGYVEHHPTIPDGELVTTSPLVELDESHDGLVLVTTESGSQYRLGEAEPTKEQRWKQHQQHLGNADEEKFEENDEGFCVEIDEQDKYDDEMTIPSMHVPEHQVGHAWNLDPGAVMTGVFSALVPQFIPESNPHKRSQNPPHFDVEVESQTIQAPNAILNSTDGEERCGWNPLLP